jgi:imidazolonepropionase-like amidohydrolase
MVGRSRSSCGALSRVFILAGLVLAMAGSAAAQNVVQPAPDRRPDEGEGPFERLVLRGAIVVDGTGAPARGPVDIVIEGNRITRIAGVGVPGVPIDPDGRPELGTKELDVTGMYVLPGFIDLHLHTGGVPKAPEAEYVYKLWMAHGITTGRGVGFGPVDWSLGEQARSAAWVRWAADKGIDGVKLFGYEPEITAAILDEAKKHDLGTTAHLAQLNVAWMNALDAARLGLGTITHYYGLFEAIYDDHDVQPWPADMNYANEQHRFGQVARQWDMIHPPGSDEWNALLRELKELDVTLDPTMTAYLASRDVMRARNADWHQRYTLPSQWDFYEPSRENHGSFYYEWTAWDEIAWKNFYRVWMQLLDDYKDMGGRVTVSSDAGYIYNLYGFSTIEEMELLQEAGFHPLEVIRSATLYGAQTLMKPKGEPIEFGIVREGYLADLVVVGENPIDDIKVLYGTGVVRLNDETGVAERKGGIVYTIKDGIVYDAKQLLADVAAMVEEQKRERGIAP